MRIGISGLFRIPEVPLPDPLPKGTPWGAVIFARVVTYLAWGIGVGIAGAVCVGIPLALWILLGD
jgi:hypothetical protein